MSGAGVRQDDRRARLQSGPCALCREAVRRRSFLRSGGVRRLPYPPESDPDRRRGVRHWQVGQPAACHDSSRRSPDFDGALGALAGFLQDYGQLSVLEGGLHPILVNVIDGEGARV